MSDSVDTTVDTTSSRERIKRALSHGKKGRINDHLLIHITYRAFFGSQKYRTHLNTYCTKS